MIGAVTAVMLLAGAAPAGFARPESIRWDASLEQTKAALDGRCSAMTVRRVDPPFVQPLVQFLGPQHLAADFGQRAILHLVAGGQHGDELDLRFLPPVGRAKARARLLGLGHGERGGAGSEAKSVRCGHCGCLP